MVGWYGYLHLFGTRGREACASTGAPRNVQSRCQLQAVARRPGKPLLVEHLLKHLPRQRVDREYRLRDLTGQPVNAMPLLAKFCTFT